MRKLTALFLALVLSASALTACGKEEENISSLPESSEEVSVHQSEEISTDADIKEEATLRYHTKTYFLKDTAGEFENTRIFNRKLCLVDGEREGSFTAELDIGTFSTIFSSWNAITYGGKVEMTVSFEVEGGEWSDYFSWGVWSSKAGVSASPSHSFEHGNMEVDILWVNKKYTPTGKIRVKLLLTRGSKSPRVHNFSITTPEMEQQQTVDVAALPKEVLNDVPMRSQLAPENGPDGNVICSPTSMVMALEYMGTKISTTTAAKGVYDNGWEAYGNWSYAVAYAGEKGYTAYLDLYDRNMMKYALSQGYVLGCSTGLTDAGHIVLVVGYTEIDGVEYYIVNDPNVNPDKVERTNYTMDYFDERWLRADRGNCGTVYVFESKK